MWLPVKYHFKFVCNITFPYLGLEYIIGVLSNLMYIGNFNTEEKQIQTRCMSTLLLCIHMYFYF